MYMSNDVVKKIMFSCPYNLLLMIHIISNSLFFFFFRELCFFAVDVDENNPMYTREFQTMLEGLDEEGCVEESGQLSEKKRRLSVDQVKALEKNFEVENKLEPERKVKLAQELGLQPRQVAVWFQNRRARWKTKQLERDYGLLKANHDALKLKFGSLQKENESLLNEIRELKSKLNEDDSKITVKEEPSISETEEKIEIEDAIELKQENGNEIAGVACVFGDFKDGSSDSDSSAILNEDNNNSPIAAAISSSGGIFPHQFIDIQGGSNSAMDINFQFSDANRPFQTQFVKIEEHNFLGEESCSNLFSDEQAPTLHWYCSDEWN
ncbi:hypothetical protein ACS0TY_029402 [Phlomoides rotata]